MTAVYNIHLVEASGWDGSLAPLHEHASLCLSGSKPLRMKSHGLQNEITGTAGEDLWWSFRGCSEVSVATQLQLNQRVIHYSIRKCNSHLQMYFPAAAGPKRVRSPFPWACPRDGNPCGMYNWQNWHPFHE